MRKYYINLNTNAFGEREVHSEECRHLKDLKQFEYLGRFDSSFRAITEAKDIYSKANGCEYCLELCHVG